MTDESTSGGAASGAAEAGRVRFDVSELKSAYCNVANAQSTAEEVVLNFGVNESWDRSRGEVEVKLLHRVVMSPAAAGRLHALLGRLIADHEARHGPISPGVAEADGDG